jgi:RNA polymerase sigma factor (TIGR02999 family)
LVDSRTPLRWESRGEFFAAAAVAMRRILVEHARQRHREKRGGRLNRVSLDEANPTVSDPREWLELDEALSCLAEVEPRKAKVVELKCFAGLDREALSNVLGISMATVDRDWLYAKAWLYREMGLASTDSDNAP